MRTRMTYLENSKLLADSGEHTVDIDIQDPITALMIDFRATNGSSTNKKNTIPENISAIEIIDGSEVLWSLDGMEAFAHLSYLQGHFPYANFAEPPSRVQVATFPIMLGRFVGDQLLALDPKKHLNPQVRIKWNMATINTVGTTGFLTDTAYLSVIASVMEGAPAPRGILTTKEVFSYTSADGTEYIPMPRDHPYRNMMVRMYLTLYRPHQVISDIKLNCDGGAHVPIDVEMEDWMHWVVATQDAFRYRHCMHQGNDGWLFLVLKEMESVQLQSESVQFVTGCWFDVYHCGENQILVEVNDVAWPHWVNWGVQAQGYCPYACVFFPFGDPMEPGDWFPARDFGSVRLELEGAVAAGAVKVVVQQERPY